MTKKAINLNETKALASVVAAETPKITEAKSDAVNNTTQTAQFATNQEEKKKKKEYVDPGIYDWHIMGLQLEMADIWAIMSFLDISHTNKETNKVTIFGYKIAKKMVNNFNICYFRNDAHLFNGRYYEPAKEVGEAFILEVLAALDVVQATADKAESIYKTILKMAKGRDGVNPILWSQIWDPPGIIPCQNGLLDVTNPELPFLMDFSPMYKVSWILDAHWDETAHNDDVNRFLETSIPNSETRRNLVEYIGLIHAKWDMSFQVFAALIGGGRNGKGALIHTMEKLFLGHTVNVSLQTMAEDKYAGDQLAYATLNSVGDMPAKHLDDTALIKQITGGDMLRCERKYRDVYQFYPKVKCIFSFNELASSSDNTYGFYRRLLVFPFVVRFEEGAQIPNFEDKLLTPKARSYWLKIAVAGYASLKKRGKFEPSNEMLTVKGEYKANNDLIAAMIQDEILVIGNDKKIEPKRLQYLVKSYAENTGRKALKESTVIERLRQAGAKMIKIHPRSENGQKREVYWTGIGLGENANDVRIEKTVTVNDQGAARIVHLSKSVLELLDESLNDSNPVLD